MQACQEATHSFHSFEQTLSDIISFAPLVPGSLFLVPSSLFDWTCHSFPIVPISRTVAAKTTSTPKIEA